MSLRAPAVALASLLVAAGAAWIGAEPPPRTEPTDPTESTEPVLGTRAGFELGSETVETIVIEPGSRLRERPDLRSTELLFVGERLELPVVERRPPWVRVSYGDLKGWLLMRGAPSKAPGAAVSAPAPWIDLEAAARARSFLGPQGRREALGPFRLLTDAPAGELLTGLEAVARGLPDAYAERFGLPAPVPSDETVVLFAGDGSYRAFAEAEPGLERLEPSGHAGNGVAALGLGKREPSAVQALLVHELTHLLNRRALGPAVDLAPWLDEGLAEDLAYSQVDASGRLKLGSLAGRTRSTNQVGGVPGQLAGDSFLLTTTGPKALLLGLLERWSEPGRPPVEELLDLSWREFAEPSRRDLLYPQSGFFVRYLLDGSGGRSAPAFRAFLRAVAGGGDTDAGALAATLGTTTRELEQGFYAWLRAQAGVVEPPRRPR